MKKQKFNYSDREKRIHRVEKSNTVVKHKKAIYNYEVDEDNDLHYDFSEQHQDEVYTEDIR